MTGVMVRVAMATGAIVSGACASSSAAWRVFPDRPVVWHEGDDQHLPKAPPPSGIEDERVGLFIRDHFTRETQRALSLETPRPAADVNAADEVPCSTWFCARHHRAPMTPEQIAAGPAGDPPRLPFMILANKTRGRAPGYVVRDASGRKFMLKLDPAGVAAGAEVVGTRLFHASGYNVPASHVVELRRGDLQIAPGATYKLSGAAERRFTQEVLEAQLRHALEGTPEVFRAVAINWISGKDIGGFDMKGRRSADPNDRIPHEDRRSLRASFVLYGWLNVADASSLNTADFYVEENGRRFVRHYIIDFGSSLGSSTVQAKAVHQARERLFDSGRVLVALGTLGVYQRAWQSDAVMWRPTEELPAGAGWVHPIEGWWPEEFQSGRTIPAHVRMTPADAYWGAKIVTAFRDEDIEAVVGTGRYTPAAAALVSYALRVRRNRIAERYLMAYAPVEEPVVEGGALCVRDLGIARGYRTAGDVRYDVEVFDRARRSHMKTQRRAAGERTCLPLPSPAKGTYLVAAIRGVKADGRPTRATYTHLAWRPAEQGFSVVGMERE